MIKQHGTLDAYFILLSTDFFDNKNNRAFNFSQLINLLQEFVTALLIKVTKFTTEENSLSHLDVEIQLNQHSFSPPAYHVLL